MSNPQKPFDRILLYFIITIGVIAVVLWSIFLIQITKQIEIANQNQQIVNQTSFKLNQTELFLHENAEREKQTRHEDNARRNQTQHEDNAREIQLNITRQIMSNHNEQMKDYIVRQNNTTQKMFQQISNAQKQNQKIIDILVNNSKNLEKIQKYIQGNTSDTNTQISKYGPENNVMGRAILKELGINATDLLQNEIYSNQTLKKMIIPN